MPPPRAPRYGLPLRGLADDTISIREARPEDAGRLADLLNDHSRAHYGQASVSRSEVGHWLGLPATWIYVAERDGRPVAYGDVQERAERTRYWLDVRALEQAAADGILGAIEERVTGRAAPTAVLYGGAFEPDGETRAAFEGRGFRAVREGLEMAIELAEETPAPVWPDGVAVRTLRRGVDDDALHAAVMEAFADHWEFAPIPLDEWRAAHLDDPDLDPELVLLAEAQGEIVGFAVDYVRSKDGGEGLVDTLGVRRPWRGRGLGLALLHASFRAFRRRGVARARLEVDAENVSGAVRLYERAGMRVAKRWVVYEKAAGRVKRPPA